MDQSGMPPPEALPKWLTEEYFRSLFRRKSPGEEIAVQNVTVKFADEERIDGKLIRVAVDVVTPNGAQTLSYVVKRPGPGQFSSTPASANMYRMESLVLGQVIPAMEKVLDAVAPGEFGQLAPRLVDYGLDENRFIMTEDLSVQDFGPVNRQVGLDLEHSLAYVKHLAAFHAASVAVMDRFESEIKAIPLLVNSEEVKFLNEFIDTSVQGVVSVLDSWEEGCKFADQVRKLGASLPSRLAQANREQPGSLNVLCHGDMFVNNILFRRGPGGTANAVRLVDFQLSRVGSFADDLAGFLVSAASDDVTRRHWERVTEEYREALNGALLALGHGARALSQEAVREALRAQRAVAQFALFHMLPHARAPAAVDLRTGGRAFDAPAFHALLRLLLPRFRALGWLDEVHRTTVSQETELPSWLDRTYFQLLLQHATGADLRVHRVHLTTCEGGTASTTDVFQATVEISFPSGVETQVFRVKCPGNVFNKMPVKSCMLEMETPILGKLLPAAEKIAKSAVSGKLYSKALYRLERGKISKSYMRKRHELKVVNHKSSDLRFCLAVIRHLALLHAASMIALDQNSGISDVPTVFSSSFLKEYFTTSIETIISHLATGQDEKVEKEKLPSDVPDERINLDTEEEIVKDDKIHLDTQKTSEKHGDEKKSCYDVSNELVQNECVQLDPHKTSIQYRLHEGEQVLHEEEVFRINNLGYKSNTTLSYVNHINKLSYPSESIDTRDNISDLSEGCFKIFNSRSGFLSHGTQVHSEDLQSRLDVHYPVGRTSILRIPPQVSSFKEVGARNTRKPSSDHLVELSHLSYCGLTERILPRFHSTSLVHIYT